MEKNIVFLICLMGILCEITLAQRAQASGYFYDHPNTRPQKSTQELVHPPQQLPGSYFEKGQLNLPNIQNPANFGQQKPFNQPSASNFGPQNGPHLININHSPVQQFNVQAENVMRFQFEILNENQANNIEQVCNPEPIVGHFKPELVDLANGGPLTRMITTCGPHTDCKTIALQSDLNRVQAVLPKSARNQNNSQQGQRGYAYGIEGRGNAGSSIRADDISSLERPKNRRLIQYTEILQDDFYN